MKKLEKYKFNDLFLEGNNYNEWFDIQDEKESDEKKTLEGDISNMPPLEGDEEEAKAGKGLKILTPNKLLTKLPVSPAQIKA